MCYTCTYMCGAVCCRALPVDLRLYTYIAVGHRGGHAWTFLAAFSLAPREQGQDSSLWPALHLRAAMSHYLPPYFRAVHVFSLPSIRFPGVDPELIRQFF